MSEGYAAEEAGLQAGDTIVKMGNKHIHFYREVSAYSMYHAGEPVKVTYERDGERYTTEQNTVLTRWSTGSIRHLEA